MDTTPYSKTWMTINPVSFQYILAHKNYKYEIDR